MEVTRFHSTQNLRTNRIYEKWAKSGLIASPESNAAKKCRKAGLRFLSSVRRALLLENQLQELLKEVKYDGD